MLKKTLQPLILNMHEFDKIMVQEIHRMMNSWLSFIDISITQTMRDITFHSFAWGLLGNRLVDQENLNQDYISAAHYIRQRLENPFLLPLFVPTLGNIKINQSVRQVNAHLDAIISTRLHSRKLHDNLLQQLLNVYYAGKPAALVVRNQVRMRLFGFLGPPAKIITWALYYLCKYPHVATRLYAEIDGLLAGRAPHNDEIPKLSYLQMMIDKLLRLYPTARALPRLCTFEDRVCGYGFLAGAKVCVFPYSIHHDARYWHQPDVFDPGRFSNATMATIPQHAYIPWGLDPGACVARQIQ